MSQGYRAVFPAAALSAGLKISSTSLHAFTFNCIAVLRGPGLLGEHCVLENRAGAVTLIPQDGALCSVNGSVVTDPCQLTQGKHFCGANMLLIFFNEHGGGWGQGKSVIMKISLSVSQLFG